MIPYIFVAVWPIVVSWFSIKGMSEKQNRNLKIVLALIPMFFLIAFRAESVGSDTKNYVRMFRIYADMPLGELFSNDFSDRVEVGYMLFCKFVGFFSHETVAFQLSYSVIYLISLSFFSRQLDDEPYWFIYFFCTLGVYTFMITGVRQSLAICICLFSYYFIKRRRLIPFLLLIWLAFFFHKSAVLFIFAYFIYSRKLSWNNIFLYTIIGVLCVVFLDAIGNFINDTLDYSYSSEQTGNGWIFTVFLSVISTAAVMILVLCKRDTPEILGAVNIGVISIVLWVLRLFTRTAERPSFYFLPFSFVIFGNALQTLPKKELRAVVKLCFFIVCMVYFVYRLSYNSTLTPYRFIWA